MTNYYTYTVWRIHWPLFPENCYFSCVLDEFNFVDRLNRNIANHFCSGKSNAKWEQYLDKCDYNSCMFCMCLVIIRLSSGCRDSVWEMIMRSMELIHVFHFYCVYRHIFLVFPLNSQYLAMILLLYQFDKHKIHHKCTRNSSNCLCTIAIFNVFANCCCCCYLYYFFGLINFRTKASYRYHPFECINAVMWHWQTVRLKHKHIFYS